MKKPKKFFRVFKPKIESNFSKIPNELWDAPVSAQSKLLWAFLASQAPDWGFSYRQICERLSITRSGSILCRRLGELMRHDMIGRVLDPDGISFHIKLIPPSDWTRPASATSQDRIYLDPVDEKAPDRIYLDPAPDLPRSSNRISLAPHIRRIKINTRAQGTPLPKPPLDGGGTGRGPTPARKQKERAVTNAELAAEFEERFKRELEATAPPPMVATAGAIAGLVRGLEPRLQDEDRDERKRALQAQLRELGGDGDA